MPVKLWVQIRVDGVSVLDGPRMSGALGTQGGVHWCHLVLEAFLYRRIVKGYAKKFLIQT